MKQIIILAVGIIAIFSMSAPPLVADVTPPARENRLDTLRRDWKNHLPGWLEPYNIVVVIDYADPTLNFAYLDFTQDVLRDQFNVTVVPTLEKARRLDRQARFDSVMVVASALDGISGRERAWLSHVYRERGVVAFVDIPIAEQLVALKMNCDWQGINDYPWAWVAVHHYQFDVDDERTENLDAAWNSCHRGKVRQFKRPIDGNIEWASVDDIDFRGGAYYAFSFLADSLNRQHGVWD